MSTMTAPSSELILEAKNLEFDYNSSGLFAKKKQPTLRDVSMSVYTGETIGILGESGSGKSTLARLMLGLLRPDKGQVLFRGQDLNKLDHEHSLQFKRSVQAVFQDPGTSLNPRRTVHEILSDVLLLHKIVQRNQLDSKVEEILNTVGLSGELASRYPHELSGGQKQRVAIGRAISVRPRVIVADEALSALDVSIQAQILELMKRIQDEYDLSYVFVSHDLNVVRQFTHRVMIMHDGEVVESGSASEIFANPKDAYTQMLLTSRLVPDPDKALRLVM